jgi:hypothetical protein
MTYKESYMSCQSWDELKEKMEKDIAVAMVINPDRVKVIKAAGEEVLKVKNF